MVEQVDDHIQGWQCVQRDPTLQSPLVGKRFFPDTFCNPPPFVYFTQDVPDANPQWVYFEDKHWMEYDLRYPELCSWSHNAFSTAPVYQLTFWFQDNPAYPDTAEAPFLNVIDIRGLDPIDGPIGYQQIRTFGGLENPSTRDYTWIMFPINWKVVLGNPLILPPQSIWTCQFKQCQPGYDPDADPRP